MNQQTVQAERLSVRLKFGYAQAHAPVMQKVFTASG
jgi:hypothetical protein